MNESMTTQAIQAIDNALLWLRQIRCRHDTRHTTQTLVDDDKCVETVTVCTDCGKNVMPHAWNQQALQDNARKMLIEANKND